MGAFDLLRKIKPRGVKFEQIEPPPSSSVFLMLFIAIIGFVNLKAMNPSFPNQILISPILIVMIFGPFYRRLIYLLMILMVNAGWYLVAEYIFILPIEEILNTVIVGNLLALGTIEVAKYFWTEMKKSSEHLVRMNEFLDQLETTLSFSSHSYVIRDGIVEILNLMVHRLLLTSGYLYSIKTKQNPILLYHSRFEDLSKIRDHEVPFDYHVQESDIDLRRLLSELSHKDILISSSRSNTSIGKKIRKKYNIKSLIFIALRKGEEITNILMLVDNEDALDLNSIDLRVISIVRSILEAFLRLEEYQIANKRLDRRNYELTKVAIDDTKTIINNSR